MGKPAVILILLLLCPVMGFVHEVKCVDINGPIFIKADGSIDPTTAPISTVDNVTYVLTGNITSNADGIIIERDNTVVDGAGYMVEGTVSGNGIDLVSRGKITVKNTQIRAFWNGIRLDSSSNNTVYGNSIAACNTGIGVYHSSNNNTISSNSLTANNYYGICLVDSSGNSINGNSITNNDVGISLFVLNDIDTPKNNHILHNDFINNRQSVFIQTGSSANVWDDGYPSGGNYWSDYNGTDADHDGIGDTPYVIDASNTDHYPLMVQYVIPEFPVFFILPLFMIATLPVILVYRRKHAQRE